MTKKIVIVLVVVILFSRYACFYIDKNLDASRRPWAYSNDTSTPLLVGRWQGQCVDPDGIIHRVDMEIFEPTSENERWKKLNKRHKNKVRNRSRTGFDGMAIVETTGTRDTCKLWGGLDTPDGKTLHLQFSPVSDVHPPGFNINILNGNWQGHTIELLVDFAWFKPDGSSFSDSADPRHDQKGDLKLQRLK